MRACLTILRHITKRSFVAFAISVSIGAAIACGPRVPELPGLQGNNIALGKTLEYSPKPNYNLTTDPDDPTQLTDGKITTGTMWLDKSAVGWADVSPIYITLDLGTPQAIDSIDISSGAGAAGKVRLPRAIAAYGSNDGTTWDRLGILSLPEPVDTLPPYQRFVYKLTAVGKTCRFVRLGIVPVTGFFSDELEVYSTGSTGQPIVPAITDLKKDLQEVLDTAGKADFQARDTAEAKSRAGALGIQMPTKRSEIPATWVRIAKAHGLRGMRLWKKNRFAPLDIHEFPSSNEAAPKLVVDTFVGEQRGDAFLISNSVDSPTPVQVLVNGSPSLPDYLRIAQCPWTMTYGGKLVASALPYSKPNGGPVTLNVRPGTTDRIWVQVDGAKLTPGHTHLDLTLQAGSVAVGNIPLDIDVSAVQLSKPELSLAGWDYMDGFGFGGISQAEEPAYRDLVKDFPIDTVCAQARILPMPKAEQFSGNALTGLDFGKVDRWVSSTPGMRNRILAIGYRDTFAGAQIGTPDFGIRFGAWMKAIGEHLHSIDPGCRVLVLLVDEPKTVRQAELIDTWAEAIKSATNSVLVFEDPLFKDLGPERVQKVFSDVDVVCFEESTILPDSGLTNQYRRLSAGKEYWYYATRPSPKDLDPTDYYRLVPWMAYADNVRGIQYWSFTDIGAAPSSWKEQGAFQTGFSPLFLGDPMTTSLQWEALRDGMWESQIFRELARAAKGTPDEREANAVISDASLLSQRRSGPIPWKEGVDQDSADSIRTRAVALLEKLRKH
ncbi:MAG: hypothetical protein P4L46_19790 [Fimbriimonas sp.]|nr:hypothetical protein [Fimbriimonas sp.]